MGKTFWRCRVCGDVHYGLAGPEFCPTCKNKNTYVSIDKKEAKVIMQL
jgi:rubrerythrin